ILLLSIHLSCLLCSLSVRVSSSFHSVPLLFFLLLRPPPSSTLFPYTTLFRSCIFAGVPRRGSIITMESIRRSFRKNSPVYSGIRSEEHTSELQSRFDLVCRLLLEKKNKTNNK